MRKLKFYLCAVIIAVTYSCSNNEVKSKEEVELETAINQLKESSDFQHYNEEKFGKLDFSQSKLVDSKEFAHLNESGSNQRTTGTAYITKVLETPMSTNIYNRRAFSTLYYSNGDVVSQISEFRGSSSPLLSSSYNNSSTWVPISTIVSSGVLRGFMTHFNASGVMLARLKFDRNVLVGMETPGTGTTTPSNPTTPTLDPRKSCVNDCIMGQYNSLTKVRKILCWAEGLAGCIATWMVECSFECGCVLGC